MTDAALDWTDFVDYAARSALEVATLQHAEAAYFPQELRRSVDWHVDRRPEKSKRMDQMRVSSLGAQAVASSTGTPEHWFNDRRSAAGIRTGSLFREVVDVGTFARHFHRPASSWCIGAAHRCFPCRSTRAALVREGSLMRAENRCPRGSRPRPMQGRLAMRRVRAKTSKRRGKRNQWKTT